MINLKTVFEQCPNCLSSRATFKSVLMDKYPTERRMVNILTILFESGIASKIKSKHSINSNEMQGFLQQIENEYGISAQYAQDAILIWATAFNLAVSAVETPRLNAAPFEQTPPYESKSIKYVQGDIEDYDIVEKSDGYYITRFNGFEEEDMTIPSMIAGKAIKGIAQGVFKGCLNVKRFYLSNGIEIIENGAFKGCKILETISLPNTLRRIGSKTAARGEGAFSKTNLHSIEIPQNVEFLGPYTFGWSNLHQIDLPDNINIIHDKTFSCCKYLSEVKLPKNLMKIEEEAFYGCTHLCEVHIPIGTQTIGNRVFYDGIATMQLTAIYIPPTVTKIADDAFGFCPRNLTIYCTAGSVAMEYARKHGIKCAKAQF